MMHESLVRACLVRYLADTQGSAAAMGEMLQQSLCGFTWTMQLSVVLLEYQRHRNEYPTLESFVPRILRFFDEYAAKP